MHLKNMLIFNCDFWCRMIDCILLIPMIVILSRLWVVGAFQFNLWGPLSNHMPCKMQWEITYSFPNFNGCTVNVWEWISNFMPLFTEYVIYHAGIKIKPWQ